MKNNFWKNIWLLSSSKKITTSKKKKKKKKKSEKNLKNEIWEFLISGRLDAPFLS